MNHNIEKLLRLIETAPAMIRSLPQEAMAERPAGKWSRREILGHLCDSAVNNLHRFVRAQYEQPLVMSGYHQDNWVVLQRYQETDTEEILTFWTTLNRHLARLISAIPQESMDTLTCQVDTGDPIILSQLLEQYVAHMEHHLKQILSYSSN